MAGVPAADTETHQGQRLLTILLDSTTHYLDCELVGSINRKAALLYTRLRVKKAKQHDEHTLAAWCTGPAGPRSKVHTFCGHNPK
jgi:hypothetical protein